MQDSKKRGDANLITKEYFDSLLLEMRHIDGVLPSTDLELYGQRFSTPIMIAAFSHLDKFARENGMVEMAKGAAAANAANWAGMGDEEELENIRATGAETALIIKPYADEDVIFRKIEHAERCGAFAVGMDVDHQFDGRGNYDNVSGNAMRPKSLKQIKSYVDATKLPFIIKGVLSEQDAHKCLEAGAQGILISHHHGILDYAIPPLMILPRIAKIVNGSIPIFVDCGIATGFDAFKALALGATAVNVGRTILGPLKETGADGVKETLEEMTAQLKGAMARTCSATVDSIDPSIVWHTWSAEKQK